MNLNSKIVSLVVGFCTLGALPLSSQNAGMRVCSTIGGVYMTSGDYNKGTISLSFDCKSSGKIKLHHFFAGRHVDIIADGKKTKLNKDSIFGYHNCKNEDYRFYKTYDEEFLIRENKGIVIYSSYVRVPSSNMKENKVEMKYFFSKTINSEIMPLTILNLKRAFPDNSKFHDMLEMEFGGGESLVAYSVTDKMYKINVLFNQSNLN